MFKLHNGVQAQPSEAFVCGDAHHIFIPACELGPERYRQFRESKPHWRPRPYAQLCREEGPSLCDGCRECILVTLSKALNEKPVFTVEECLSSGAMPIFTPVQKLNNHAKMSDITSFRAVLNANNGVAQEEMARLKPPLTVKTSGMGISSIDNMEHMMKPTALDDESEHAESGRMKDSSLAFGQATASEHATSSEDISEEDTMTGAQTEILELSEHAIGTSQGDVMASGRIPKSAGSVRVDESPFSLEGQDLFKYVVATRQIPYGQSYSKLDILMQRMLHDYFKESCPPCPHCNINTFVKFRYFNNSGKSSLLQPRYSCRNPDKCLTVQEKTGKTGSRDFTLPKSKESDLDAPAVFGSGECRNRQRGRSSRQPQWIQHCGSKRPAQDLNSLSRAAERAAKLPNTTLSLQTVNGPGPFDASNLQIVDASKEKALQLAKPADDSNRPSSFWTASEEKTAFNVRCQAKETSENGRLVVQPISVQQVGSTKAKTETSCLGKSSKGGKIAELNICMYIDLSTAS